jgi:hypothetical protein
MDSLPPAWNPIKFNTSAFQGKIYLTKQEADGLYLSITAGKNLGLIDGITPGIVSASKAVIVDSSKNIIGFNNIQSATIDCNGLNINNSTDLNLYGTTNSIHMHSSTSSTILLSGSIFNSITMQASAGFILMSGNNQYVYLSGTSNYLRIDNTAASTSSTTGTIRTAGGAYFGNDVLVNTQISFNGSIINQTNAGYLVSLAPGTVSASKAVVVDVNKDISSFRNLTATNLTGTIQTASQPNITSLGTLTSLSSSGILVLTNSSVSTTSTSNAVQIAGGLYIDKAILNNSYYNCNTNNIGATSHSVSTQAICLNNQAIYFRGQNNSDTNHGIMFSGVGYANWNSGNGWASANQDGPVLYGNQAVIIGNLNSSNTETSCAIFSGTTTRLLGNCTIASTTDATSLTTGSLTTLGGISAAKTIYGKQLVADGNGSHLTLKNGDNAYVLQSCQSDGTLTYTCTYNASNYAQYQIVSCSPGTSGSGTNYKGQMSIGRTVRANDGHRLDFGATAQDNIICLFQTSNLTATYMIGANNSAINITSAGSNGVKLTYSSASGVGAPATIGTTIFHAKGNGNCITTSNLISNTGLHSYGSDATDLSSYGAGAHMHYAASTAAFFGYNYNAGTYTDMSMGNLNIFIKSSNGYVGIQQTSPVCPLHVSTTANQTTASGFGFLNNSGAGNSTGFTNRAFSIRSDGGIYVTAGEINVTSDIRFKDNINEIDDKKALDFITKIKPISFSYKNANKNLHYGYSAQELVKNKFNVLVGSTNTDEPLEERELINDEGEKITIPKDTKLVVNLLASIPLLHRALQLSNDRIKKNEEEIEELRALLDTKADSRKKRT